MKYEPHNHQEKLDELLARIKDLPPDQQARLAPIVEATKARQSDIEKANASAQDALDDWRMTMKYMIFATEARRREKN